MAAASRAPTQPAETVPDTASQATQEEERPDIDVPVHEGAPDVVSEAAAAVDSVTVIAAIPAPTESEPVPDAPTASETVPEALTEPEPVTDAATEPELVLDVPTEPEPVTDAPAEPEMVTDAPTDPRPVLDEPTKPELEPRAPEMPGEELADTVDVVNDRPPLIDGTAQVSNEKGDDVDGSHSSSAPAPPVTTDIEHSTVPADVVDPGDAPAASIQTAPSASVNPADVVVPVVRVAPEVPEVPVVPEAHAVPADAPALAVDPATVVATAGSGVGTSDVPRLRAADDLHSKKSRSRPRSIARMPSDSDGDGTSHTRSRTKRRSVDVAALIEGRVSQVRGSLVRARHTHVQHC